MEQVNRKKEWEPHDGNSRCLSKLVLCFEMTNTFNLDYLVVFYILSSRYKVDYT
jgi:hypothetical protein